MPALHSVNVRAREERGVTVYTIAFRAYESGDVGEYIVGTKETCYKQVVTDLCAIWQGDNLEARRAMRLLLG